MHAIIVLLLSTLVAVAYCNTKVLIACGELTGNLADRTNDVLTKIAPFTTGVTFEVVDMIQTMPTDAKLSEYDVVFTWRNNANYDNIVWGTRLTTYIQSGGAVVVAYFAIYTALGGTFVPGTSDYSTSMYAIYPGSYSTTRSTLGTYDATHPIMTGVSSFDNGFKGYHNGGTAIHPSATLVASYTDGSPIVATRTIGTSRRVDINFYPPSSDVQSNLWVTSTDGAKLIANSIMWAAGLLASGISDPIITGFNGEKFQFDGAPDRIFNMVSMPDLQISAKFIAGDKPNTTYMGEIGVKQGGVTLISFDLDGATMLVLNQTTQEIVAHKTLPYPMSKLELPNGGIAIREKSSRLELRWPHYSVFMKRMFEKHDSVLVEYIDISVTVTLKHDAVDDIIHGVIGQTYNRNVIDSGVEGMWEDYAAPVGDVNVFTARFPANNNFYKYSPTATPEYMIGGEAKAVHVTHSSSDSSEF